MTLNVNPAAVGMSAATEVGIATDLAASSGATSEALLVNVPMALDADSLAFAEALSGAGAAYTGVKAEHVAERGIYAGSQTAASAAYEASEAIRAVENTLS